MIVAPAAVEGDVAHVRGDDARHLAVVLSTRVDDPVSVADGSGALWQGAVAAVSPDAVDVRLGERWDVPAERPRLVVVHGLPKGRKLDAVVRMLSEVGVDRLVPVRTARSDVRPTGAKATKVVERWRAVAHAAAKQSRRVRPLVVDDVADWPGPLATPGVRGAVVWEEAVETLGDVLDEMGEAAEVVLAVGAEGGLSAAEVARAGPPPAVLGRTILRTETAAVVAAAIALHRLGRLG